MKHDFIVKNKSVAFEFFFFLSFEKCLILNAKMFTNWLTPALTTNTPQPDVILEIGPPPTARFAAHRTLLAAHSGYLRSAIRLDDHVIDTPIYIPNITAEQFTPLLTYMYTGFLDLNMDNIFGVLLATHILHMPRALEICRAFLAHTQAEGYLGGAFLTHSLMEKFMPKNVDGGGRIIRPIASKAPVSGLGFIAPPTTNTLLPSQDTLFKSLSNANNHNQTDSVSNVEAEKREQSPVPSTSKPDVINSVTKENDDNDKISAKRIVKSHKKHHKAKTARSSPIEIKSPVNVTEDNSNKVVIDVASCDGPVRFQRVLNDAYGRSQPLKNSVIRERNRINVNTSFHMQMARNISERQSMSSTESENSQEIVVHDQSNAFSDNNNGNVSNKNHSNNNGGTSNSKPEEIFTCVYCKHTFKSQYCYQKHAKRHINPLSIDGELIVETTMDSSNEKDDGSNNSSSDSSGRNQTKIYGNANLKREVRPLDMNVQYYPCKTCGSKFPSYYFVHKHRKLCHANEEN